MNSLLLLGSLLLSYAVLSSAGETPILPNQPIYGQTVQKFAWQYYSIALNSTSAVGFTFNATASQGTVFLYVKVGSLPSLTSYDYKGSKSPKNNPLDDGTSAYKQTPICKGVTGTYYVGVYGYSTAFFSVVSTNNFSL